ncbi:MAG: response regulator [Paracoccaceae bacterium]
MRVLIVESHPERGRIWGRHLERSGFEVEQASTGRSALGAIRHSRPDVIVLNIALRGANALAIADFAACFLPDARIILVTGSSLFTSGSIFSHAVTACAVLSASVRAEDLSAVVEHYATVRA